MKKMKWKTTTAKNSEELEFILNSLEEDGCEIRTVEMDQAHGGFVVIYKTKEKELLSD